MYQNKFIAGLLVTFLVLVTPMTASAIGGPDAVLSVSVSVVPSAANDDLDNNTVPGSETFLDDGAYQFNVSYTWGRKNNLFAKAEYEYIGVRAYKFIEEYTEDGTDGFSELEGLAFFYGQRYMLSQASYNGLGVGWYAGVALGTDKWIEPFDSGEDSDPVPLAVAEAFYRYSQKQFFIEPGLVIGLDKNLGSISFVPAILVGAEF